MRECGACQLCCTLMSVETLGKPMNRRCEHQCDRGCAIYERRPYACRWFNCLWLQGYFRPTDRPDIAHAVWSSTWRGLAVHEEEGWQGEAFRRFPEIVQQAHESRTPVDWYVGGVLQADEEGTE